jgi:hypothetical protein
MQAMHRKADDDVSAVLRLIDWTLTFIDRHSRFWARPARWRLFVAGPPMRRRQELHYCWLYCPGLY